MPVASSSDWTREILPLITKSPSLALELEVRTLEWSLELPSRTK